MNVGKIIKADRALKGIGQKELAIQLGVSQQAVSQWEGGAKMAPVYREKVCEILGVDLPLVDIDGDTIHGSYQSPDAITIERGRHVQVTRGEDRRHSPHTIEMNAQEFVFWQLYLLVPPDQRESVLQDMKKQLVLIVSQLDH